ncbi:MAG: 16S rRNA (cytosine(967)-C(5))-methyltransferase RsmB [Pseudomonadota bacterium]
MRDIQRVAADTLAAVFAGSNLNRALLRAWQRHPRLTAQQRGAIQDICYGTLRHGHTLQAVLEQLLHQPLRSERLRSLLLAGLYQLQHGKAAPYAVVDHAVAVAPALGEVAAQGLVNAVLRNFLRRREALLARAAADESGRYSYPAWWVDKLKRQYPQQYGAVLDAGNLHPPMTLRVNRRKTSTDQYLALLGQAGIVAQSVEAGAIRLAMPVAVEKLPGFAEGMVSVQDAGAQWAALPLDVVDGLRVLDACAAPGGKTTHILETAAVELIALDSDDTRLQRVRDSLGRLGLSAQLLCTDAGEVGLWWDGRPFDRILLDAPCSAAGVVRRHPDIKWLRRESDIAQFAAQQRRLLDALWRTLARGGKLLYTTCSVFREENQEQVAAFLARQPDAESMPLALPGADDGQLLPDAQHDGFFYALFRKT